VTLLTIICLAAAAAPKHAELQASPWRVRTYGGYPFIFISYGGPWNDSYQRAAHEAREQRLLTPTSDDADFAHPAESAATEWAWNVKPEGATREECHAWLREYFDGRRRLRAHSNAPMPDGIPFYTLTGHSWYSPYGARWAGDLIGLEVGENIIAMQAQIAFLRGAARQNELPFYVQMSQWYGGTIPLYEQGEDEYTPHDLDEAAVLDGISKGGIAIPNGGHAPSLLARMWHVAWLSGAAIVCPENCQQNFFTDTQQENWEKPQDERVPLSPIGGRAQRFMRLVEEHPDIGTPYTPFAVMLDEYAGFNGFPLTQPRPWNVLDPTWEDRQISLFWEVAFPRSMYLDFLPGVDEELSDRRLVASPYGDTFDALLSDAPSELLTAYPALFLVGPHRFDGDLVARLEEYVAAGGKLFATYAHDLPDGLATRYGTPAERLPDPMGTARWLTPPHWGASEETLRSRKQGLTYDPYEREFMSSLRETLEGLVESHLPVNVEGDVEYLVNRTSEGWLVGLVNSYGVTKGRMTPVSLDATQTRDVRIALRDGGIRAASEWVEGDMLRVENGVVTLTVPPGETRIVQLTTSPG
jgi:hypothetical protein